LLEAHLPDGDGLELIPHIKEKSPDTKVIILTSSVDDVLVVRAIKQNVQGILSKGCSLEELLNSIRAAAKGELAIPSHLLVGVLRRQASRTHSVREDEYLWEKLTHREMDVLNCLALGQSSKIIASQLHITPLTVRTHIRNLMSKLGAHTRLEAVSFALSRGIIEAPQGQTPVL
jgi:two-component system, NarL family, nitrate/nitrite response regulator NarL